VELHPSFELSASRDPVDGFRKDASWYEKERDGGGKGMGKEMREEIVLGRREGRESKR